MGRGVNAAVDHLTEILVGKVTVRYNEHFYRDGDAALDQELAAKFGTDRRGISPAIYVDLAVERLEQAGFVTTKQLAETMGDGEQDYEITITEAYLEFIIEGGTFRSRDGDL